MINAYIVYYFGPPITSDHNANPLESKLLRNRESFFVWERLLAWLPAARAVHIPM
jgi:hypothetical protein